MGDKPRTFRVLLQAAVIETDGYSTERIWAEEKVVVPLERIAALDAQAMIDRLVRDVVHIAGQAEEEEPDPSKIGTLNKKTA